MSISQLFKSEGAKITAKSFGYGVAAMTLATAAVVLWPISVVASGVLCVGGGYCAVHADTVCKRAEKKTGQKLWKQDAAGFSAAIGLMYMLTPGTAQIRKMVHLTPSQKPAVSVLASAQNVGPRI